MSYDGLFQLGMGAVLLKASQTEDTIGSGVSIRRARLPYDKGRRVMSIRNAPMRRTGAGGFTPGFSATPGFTDFALPMRDRIRAGALAWSAARRKQQSARQA